MGTTASTMLCRLWHGFSNNGGSAGNEKPAETQDTGRRDPHPPAPLGRATAFFAADDATHLWGECNTHVHAFRVVKLSENKFQTRVLSMEDK